MGKLSILFTPSSTILFTFTRSVFLILVQVSQLKNILGYRIVLNSFSFICTSLSGIVHLLGNCYYFYNVNLCLFLSFIFSM